MAQQKSKLIVNIDASVLRRARQYAATRNTNLSNIVERFLRALTKEVGVGDLPPITRKASGICRIPDRPVRELMEEALEEKYRIRQRR